MITNYSFYLRGIENEIATISLIGRGKHPEVFLLMNGWRKSFPNKEEATEYLKKKIGDAFQFLRRKRKTIKF